MTESIFQSDHFKEVVMYIGAIDQGTTSTRFIIFDTSGKIIAVDQKEHQQIFPQPGWVEHNPLEIWQNTQEVISKTLQDSGIRASEIAAVGITNQRETAVLWEKSTGKPVHPAIVWQDTRTDKICDQLAQEGGQNRFQKKTGLPLATYFSGPKIKWVLDQYPEIKKRAQNGEILFGNIDTWLIWNLTGGPEHGLHITDVTNASRTLCMNLETLDWDQEILQIMGIPAVMLPEIRSSSEVYGKMIT